VHEPDEYGTVNMVRRKNARKRIIRTLVGQYEVPIIENTIRQELLGYNCLFIGEDNGPYKFGGLILLGYMENFEGTLEKDDIQTLEFIVKEMI
jgi:hypothetical protein